MGSDPAMRSYPLRTDFYSGTHRKQPRSNQWDSATTPLNLTRGIGQSPADHGFSHVDFRVWLASILQVMSYLEFAKRGNRTMGNHSTLQKARNPHCHNRHRRTLPWKCLGSRTTLGDSLERREHTFRDAKGPVQCGFLLPP